MSDGQDTNQRELQAENAGLRERLAELERKLARREASAESEAMLQRGATEREALLAEAERIAHMGSWVWDLGTGRIAWSDELFRILGYDPAVDTASSEAYFARIHPEDLERIRATSGRILETRRSERAEYRVLLPSGSIRHVSTDSALVFGPAGDLQGLVGTVLDVSEARETEETLLRAAEERHDLEERLRQAQKMEALGQLAGGIAHDFNNLLTIIVGGVDAVRSGRSSGQTLGEIEGAARSAATLTQRLLAFSRRAVVIPRAVDLRVIVEEIRPLITRSIGEQIRTSFEYSGEPCVARVDTNHTQQVLLNLVVNARDAMPSGGRLDVRVDRTRIEDGEVHDLPPGEYVLVVVSDTGAGMGDETLPHIFEPFFTTKGVGKGTGLGLSLVYGAMKQSGGAVTVTSMPGRGTTFRLYFPFSTERPGATSQGKGGLPRAATVLLVEDDPAVRRVVAGTLQSLGSRVVSVQSGKEALAEWGQRARPFDLLVTDIVMPEMRGDEIAQALLARHPGLPVLFITGYVDRAMDPSSFPCARILRKPFSADELSATLADLLSEAAAQ